MRINYGSYMDFDVLFDGKYKILRLLGSGGSGSVYLAENVRLKNLWAIKEIQCDRTYLPQAERELEVLKNIRHPALPRVVDVVREDGRIYLIEDYFEGDNAEEFLTVNGCADTRIAMQWASDICDIMIFLHSREPEPIIYRDLKPSNIIISPGGAVRLVDFGSVRHYKSGSPSDTIYIGTRGYAAPEQYGLGQTSISSDIFSFGVTMLHILTGKRPAELFREGRVSGTGVNLPDPLWKLLQKCIEKEPEKRYRNFQEVKSGIRALTDDSEPGLKPENTVMHRPQFHMPQRIRQDNRAPARKPVRRPPTPPPENMAVNSPFENMAPDPPLDNPPQRAQTGPIGIYRCATFSIIRNHEFAFELAYRAWERFGLRVYILDMDFESSFSELYFKPDRDEKIRFGNSLLNVIKTIENTVGDVGAIYISGPSFGQSRHMGPILLNEPEPEYAGVAAGKLKRGHGETLRRLLTEVSVCADACLILTGESIFSDINLRCFQNSHYVICPGHAEINEIGKFNNTSLLAERFYGIPADRFKFIVWDQRQNGVSDEVLSEFPDESLAGAVRKSRKRDDARNGGAYKKSYAFCMESAVKKDYDEIIRALGIIK